MTGPGLGHQVRSPDDGSNGNTHPAGGGMTALLPAIPDSRPFGLLTYEALCDEARRYAVASKSPRTVRIYRTAWRDFTAWCDIRGLDALPATPETVALYVSDLAGWAKVATIGVKLSAISQAHQAAGHESPTKTARVRITMQGIRRTLGTAQEGKLPILIEDLRAMMAVLDDDLLGIRDRALLLIGFAGGFRRSELVGLDVADVVEGPNGLTVLIRRSKTDQEGAGRKLGVPYLPNPDVCPVRAYRAWLAASGIESGPIFRPFPRKRMGDKRLSGKAVALVVKRTIAATGIDPARYAGHSLRAAWPRRQPVPAPRSAASWRRPGTSRLPC